MFFTIILTFYGLPLNIVRDVWVTARSFISRLRAFHRYQNATRNMNQRYPNATEEEMSAMTDRTCIICREEMTLQAVPETGQPPQQADGPNTTPKKLPCGHVLHFACLRSWLERQQVCPTCRRPVVQGAQAAGIGAPPGAPGVQGQHPAPERPGPRIFQLGPIRIGVGAARGNNMFEDLQNQMADGRPQAAQRAEQNGPQQ